LQPLLARYPDRSLVMSVERPEESDPRRFEKLELILNPRRERTLGLEMGMGPIVAVRKGSPAERAGLREGDRLVRVDGQPVGDPLFLPQRLTDAAGREVTLELIRGVGDEAQPVTVTLVPEFPREFQRDFSAAKPVASDSAGFAYDVTARVSHVIPGSPADQAGIRDGDVVRSVQFVPSAEQQEAWKELRKELSMDETDTYELRSGKTRWPEVWSNLQDEFPATSVKMIVERNGNQLEIEMAPVDSYNRFVRDRGIFFVPAEEIHRTSSWVEAFQLGIRETKDGIYHVKETLRLIFTGRIAVTNLRGPATIAVVAGAEAMQSTARLLIFLTMLSANLAVLNFLPIPVLDGGHALFLLYEGIFRRPVDERVAVGLTMLGFTLLLGLMVFVIGMDVLDLTGRS
jgi:regulator of sigma E protease